MSPALRTIPHIRRDPETGQFVATDEDHEGRVIDMPMPGRDDVSVHALGTNVVNDGGAGAKQERTISIEVLNGNLAPGDMAELLGFDMQVWIRFDDTVAPSTPGRASYVSELSTGSLGAQGELDRFPQDDTIGNFSDARRDDTTQGGYMERIEVHLHPPFNDTVNGAGGGADAQNKLTSHRFLPEWGGGVLMHHDDELDLHEDVAKVDLGQRVTATTHLRLYYQVIEGVETEIRRT